MKKENTTKKVYQNFIGIDISKGDFYVSLHNSKSVTVFPNTPAGYQRINPHRKFIPR